MRIPGNMWVEVWQSARPVPVRRQKRLFDETKEAEKVFVAENVTLIKNDFLKHKQANINVESRRFGVIMTPLGSLRKDDVDGSENVI